MTRQPLTPAAADRHEPRPCPRRPAGPPHPRSRQGGAVLITGLIFLTLLTILGTTSVMNNVLQERMAANTRNRDLAFESAEHALDAAHGIITRDGAGPRTLVSMSALVGDAGTHGVRDIEDRPMADRHKNDVGYWLNAFDWTSADLGSATGNDLIKIHAQPRYVIERLLPASENLYRVTARGVGATADAVVILQTLYQFK